jgi:SAM-dependent methyltransferase
MEIPTYAAEAAIEADHWWFVGRRGLFAALLKGFPLPPDAAILDVGTGTGANLRLLRDLGFARVVGVDFSAEAIRFCAEKGLGSVQPGDVCALPFADRRFDLVFATDVIEHVEDDLAALREIRRVLRPGGHLLLTVPAFPILWGLQDEVSHHRRRYRLPLLVARLRAAGFAPQRYFYFNYLLFLPILAARRLMRLLQIRLASEGELNAKWLNRALTSLFRLDVKTAPWLRPPFGASALVVATRP